MITPDGTTVRPRPRVDSALVKVIARAPVASDAGYGTAGCPGKPDDPGPQPIYGLESA